ncbi:MAG TPA: hypothetical protein VE757_04100 [Gaiellaceae bacterium]|nr:hypothetical protein [Gaiellaceae bacterium]
MNKARLITLMVSLSLLAFYLQGFVRVFGWFFGHSSAAFDGNH